MLTLQLCDFQGIWTSITRNPYKLMIFQGLSPYPLSPSGSAYDAQHVIRVLIAYAIVKDSDMSGQTISHDRDYTACANQQMI